MSRQIFVAFSLLTLVLAAACEKNSKPKAEGAGSGSVEAEQGKASGPALTKPGEAGQAVARSPHGSRPAAVGKSGKVTETMNSGGYTYAQLDTGRAKLWLAGPETKLAVGDVVSFAGGSPMKNFHSKTLDRTFETILFVQALQVGGAASAGNPHAGMPAGHPAPTEAAAVDLKGIEKAKGGYTVAELFARKGEVSGKEVSVRGKVTKVNERILGKNWIHLRDGTGAAGANDLVVTTAPEVKVAVGNTVLIKGKASTDKDFGAGYKYALIVEDAAVQVE